MMNSRRYLSALTLILTIVLYSSTVLAQEKDTTDSKQQDAELRAKAISLLQSLAGQVGSLQARENRARIASNIAGSLWKHDEQRARALLASVEDDIRAGLQPSKEYDEKHTHTLMVFLKLRTDTVERIAKHDARAALAFFQATAPEFGKEFAYEARAAERALEVQLAKQIATENPEMAVDLGRKSLAHGLTDDVLFILRKAARKDKQQARILHKEILEKLKESDFPGFSNVQFTSNLVHSFVPPEADETTFRELINVLVTTAIDLGCANKPSEDDDPQACYWLGSIFGYMEKVDPARSSKLKRWEPNSEIHHGAVQAFLELNDLSRGGSVDEMLALASKYPEIATEIHSRAVMEVVALGDSERARKLVNDLVSDPDRKQWLLDHIARSDAWQMIDEENVKQVERTISNEPREKVRGSILLFAANRAAKTNPKMALKLLLQADELISSLKADSDQTEAQLALASLYCLVKSDRGFVMMESLVPRLNDLVAAAVKLDGYDSNYLSENEWNMSATGRVGKVLTVMAENAGYFAWYDFDRAVNLASQFERNEIRMMAQLKLAQGILAGPPTGDLVTGYYSMR